MLWSKTRVALLERMSLSSDLVVAWITSSVCQNRSMKAWPKRATRPSRRRIGVILPGSRFYPCSPGSVQLVAGIGSGRRVGQETPTRPAL